MAWRVLWESLNPSADGDKPSCPRGEAGGAGENTMERALGGQVGSGPAQPGEVQDPGEVGAGGRRFPSSFLVLAISHSGLAQSCPSF